MPKKSSTKKPKQLTGMYYTLNIPLYFFEYKVYFGHTFDSCYKAMKDTAPHLYRVHMDNLKQDDEQNFAAFCITNAEGSTEAALLIKAFDNDGNLKDNLCIINSIAHEVFHMLCYLNENRGGLWSNEISEPGSYLFGNVVEAVTRRYFDYLAHLGLKTYFYEKI